MPTSPFKTKTFHLTALDREMLDPERGGLNDISWWYRLVVSPRGSDPVVACSGSAGRTLHTAPITRGCCGRLGSHPRDDRGFMEVPLPAVDHVERRGEVLGHFPSIPHAFLMNDVGRGAHVQDLLDPLRREGRRIAYDPMLMHTRLARSLYHCPRLSIRPLALDVCPKQMLCLRPHCVWVRYGCR